MATNGVELNSQYVRLPVGTTAERPGSAAFGMIRKNSTTSYVEYYDTASTSWLGIGAFFAQGGTETTSGSYKIHTFTSAGSFSVFSGTKAIELLIVAGGGGTGNDVGGGGGAGGLIYNSAYTATPGAYSITIGSGGASGNTSYVTGTPGTNSTGFGYTAIGGGGGGAYPSGAAQSGGSGGGGGAPGGSAGASGTPGQGYPGGSSAPSSWGSGAGGGAGGTGPNGIQNTAVSGGAHATYSTSGSSANYAGGGYGNSDSGPVYSTGYDQNNSFRGTYGYGSNGTGTTGVTANGGIAIIRYTA